MLLNAKTKGGDTVKQPEGLDYKPLVFKEHVTVAGRIQGDGPARLLLWVQRIGLSCRLKRHKTKRQIIADYTEDRTRRFNKVLQSTSINALT